MTKKRNYATVGLATAAIVLIATIFITLSQPSNQINADILTHETTSIVDVSKIEENNIAEPVTTQVPITLEGVST